MQRRFPRTALFRLDPDLRAQPDLEEAIDLDDVRQIDYLANENIRVEQERISYGYALHQLREQVNG